MIEFDHQMVGTFDLYDIYNKLYFLPRNCWQWIRLLQASLGGVFLKRSFSLWTASALYLAISSLFSGVIYTQIYTIIKATY